MERLKYKVGDIVRVKDLSMIDTEISYCNPSWAHGPMEKFCGQLFTVLGVGEESYDFNNVRLNLTGETSIHNDYWFHGEWVTLYGDKFSPKEPVSPWL